jgi:hypothetical protein
MSLFFGTYSKTTPWWVVSLVGCRFQLKPSAVGTRVKAAVTLVKERDVANDREKLVKVKYNGLEMIWIPTTNAYCNW